MRVIIKTMYQAMLSKGPRQYVSEALLDKTYDEFGALEHHHGTLSAKIMQVIEVWGVYRESKR